MSRDNNKPRLLLNDIIVESIEVIGETLNFPVLAPVPHFGTGRGSGSGYDSGCSSYYSGEGSAVSPDGDYENSCNQTRGAESDPDGHDDGPQFLMIVSEYNVLNSVLDCAYGLPRPSGYYNIDGYDPMSVRVDIEQVNQS